VALYRQGKFRDVKLAKQAAASVGDVFSQMDRRQGAGAIAVLIKADVQGSVPRRCAIRCGKLAHRRSAGQGHRERRRRHHGVRRATRRRLRDAVIIGFNVRADCGRARCR
jgi:translation initiation factor IF-2